MILSYPEDLPICSRREDILSAIRDHPVVILAGETGSGKTTQLPKMGLEYLGDRFRGQIGCTQPRRVAAMSVSRRVAEELQVRWGGLVGCKMRFSDDTSAETRVKFMTDGILLAEIQSDPLLRAYSMLILDEAHERSLNIDFLLGYLKTLLPKRPDLKLIVTSATIDTELFSRHFGGAPIIEVSGRLYPVKIRYQDALEADEEDLTHLEQCLEATENLLIELPDGDVLIFMPTERDVRECRDLLQGRLGQHFEVLPLYGRMPSQDQQRIFSPGLKRRVIVATNVAETSITVPRIAAVVDSGLARISRYNARTRTKRLPIEPVSQSSANQRAGRAGRLRAGICVRLYDEDDFKKRPLFTQPEIQRSNLAEVILKMKAFQLGEIEDFPFLQAPSAASIRAGYDLLLELGALSETQDMTERGRELAALPLDPTLGRMLLQARTESCLPEMLILAAGLSIADPRERPEEKKELAQKAHQRFSAPGSDFMTLLKIWQAAPAPDKGSKNALRRFCRESFLSFTRMTEWRDVWAQLKDLFARDLAHASAAEVTSHSEKEGGQMPSHSPNAGPAQRDQALHRCLLAGHLGHIGMRAERNLYKAGGGREVMIFPGSSLYERRDKNTKPGVPEKTRQPAWIVAAEIVQTSQLFARTVAGIQPEWAAELGEHLLERRYAEPHWSAKAGRVLVSERLLLHGLEVLRRKIDFGKIDPHGATLLFIRGAMCEEGAHLPHRFFELNQKLRARLEAALTRVRSSRVYGIEEKLFEFYRAHLHGQKISSIHDFNQFMNGKLKEQPDYLIASETDLTGGEDLSVDLDHFPDKVTLSNSVLPLTYAYKPGQDEDGVTVQVPLPVAEKLSPAQLQWLVPGLREEIIHTLLRALPKALRRTLMPVEQTAARIAKEFTPDQSDFLDALSAHLRIHYSLQVQRQDWPEHCIPDYLKPRLQVLAQGQKTVLSTRDLSEVKAHLKKVAHPSNAWALAVQRYERYGLHGWAVGDVPESVLVEEIAGAEVLGYPGLEVREPGEVDLRLFKTAKDAARATPAGIRALAESVLAKDLAWLQKELRSWDRKEAPPRSLQGGLQALNALVKPTKAATILPISQQAFDHILSHLLRLDPLHPLREKRFSEMLERTRSQLPLITHRTHELLRQCEDLRQRIQQLSRPYPGLQQDLDRLLPPDLLSVTPHEQLQHLPRYLKAMQVRAERAVLNPAKDRERALAVADFADWRREVREDQAEAFRWLYEEYRVSLFAQELGTAKPVSIKRLEALLG